MKNLNRHSTRNLIAVVSLGTVAAAAAGALTSNADKHTDRPAAAVSPETAPQTWTGRNVMTSFAKGTPIYDSTNIATRKVLTFTGTESGFTVQAGPEITVEDANHQTHQLLGFNVEPKTSEVSNEVYVDTTLNAPTDITTAPNNGPQTITYTIVDGHIQADNPQPGVNGWGATIPDGVTHATR